MMKIPVEVFFMDDRSTNIQTGLVPKMLTVFDAAGLGEIIEKGDLVAVKLHMGEWNTTSYIRPVYARAICDKIKELGGKPFITDTTTLPYYPYASRTTAYDYLKTAERNGFSSATMGCPIIIADGFFGNDDVLIDLPEGNYLKEQYIGAAIAHADAMIVLTHFKGHPLGVFGGAIKNMGVGCASKRGKHNLHLARDYNVGWNVAPYNPQLCMGKQCPKSNICENLCPVDAIEITEDSLIWHQDKCIGCLNHIFPTSECGAFLSLGMADLLETSCVAIADSALAAQKAVGKDKIGYINLALDISPWCDCVMWADRPLIPNLGVFASKDMVAIDMACLDMARESDIIAGSVAEMKALSSGIEKFSAAGALIGSSEMIQVNAAAMNGGGSREYKLKKVNPVSGDEVSQFLIDPMPVSQKIKKYYQKQMIVPKTFKRAEKIDLTKYRHREASE